MVSSNKAACAAALLRNPHVDSNNRFTPVNNAQKKAPKFANKKSRLDIWKSMPTILARHLLPEPTNLPPPSSSLTNFIAQLLPAVLSVATMWNKKKCSFQLLWTLLPPSLCDFLLILSTHISLLLLPRFTLCAIQPGFDHGYSNPFFWFLYFILPGNWLPGFSIQIYRNGHTVCPKYFLCLPGTFSFALLSCRHRATLLILILPIPGFSFHNNSPKLAMQLSYLVSIYWLAFQSALFPLYCSTHDFKPSKSP